MIPFKGFSSPRARLSKFVKRGSPKQPQPELCGGLIYRLATPKRIALSVLGVILMYRNIAGFHEALWGMSDSNILYSQEAYIQQRIESRRKLLDSIDIAAIDLSIRNSKDTQTCSVFGILTETIYRSFERQTALQQAENEVSSQNLQDCSQSVSDTRHHLQPMEWYRPVDGRVLRFDDTDQLRLIQQHFESLLPIYTKMDAASRLRLWCLCSVFWYGGIVGTEPEKAPESMACGQGAMTIVEGKLLVLAAPSRHPQLGCILYQIQKDLPTVLTWSSIVQMLLGDAAENKSVSGVTTEAGLHCPFTGSLECCGPILRLNGATSKDQHPHFLVSVLQAEEASDSHPTGSPIEIKESQSLSVRKAKKTPEFRGRFGLDCLPGWRCRSCLGSAVHGSFEACANLCSPCYIQNQCGDDHPIHNSVPIGLVGVPKTNVIPRLVHQIWDQGFTTDTNPELARMQYAWRSSGFDYRFYTDKIARSYVVQHFPPRFADAMDSLVHLSHKRDLFRLLILMREGGIFADADVQLETRLDTFLTPTMSFFAARDTVFDLADQHFCLWKGLVGAAPGHPFLVKAVERVVNAISNRWDRYDLERDVCHKTGPSMKTWKLQSQPVGELIFGSCALGLAVNDVLEYEDLLADFQVGWLPSDRNRSIGDALILMADQHDMGALRFSDVDRNILVASTNLIGISHATKAHTTAPPSSLLRHAANEKIYFDEHGSNEFVKVSPTRLG